MDQTDARFIGPDLRQFEEGHDLEPSSISRVSSLTPTSGRLCVDVFTGYEDGIRISQ